VPIGGPCREGAIVDISGDMDDWTGIKPHHITAGVEVKKGDILIYNTGWHRFYNGCGEEDEERALEQQAQPDADADDVPPGQERGCARS